MEKINQITDNINKLCEVYDKIYSELQDLYKFLDPEERETIGTYTFMEEGIEKTIPLYVNNYNRWEYPPYWDGYYENQQYKNYLSKGGIENSYSYSYHTNEQLELDKTFRGENILYHNTKCVSCGNFVLDNNHNNSNNIGRNFDENKIENYINQNEINQNDESEINQDDENENEINDNDNDDDIDDNDDENDIDDNYGKDIDYFDRLEGECCRYIECNKKDIMINNYVARSPVDKINDKNGIRSHYDHYFFDYKFYVRSIKYNKYNIDILENKIKLLSDLVKREKLHILLMKEINNYNVYRDKRNKEMIIKMGCIKANFSDCCIMLY